MADHDNPFDKQALRARAEKWLTSGGRHKTAQMRTDDVMELIYELETHQVELEIQNEELRNNSIELENIKDRYAELYDFSPAGYFTIDSEGNITQANRTLADLLCVPKAELVNQQLSAFIIAEDQDSYYRYRQRMVATGTQANCEIRLCAIDGTALWVRLDSKPAGIGRNGSHQFWSVVSSIDDRKEKEAKQEQMQADLRHAQKMRTIGVLTAHVAHDFNNLLSPILTLSQVLLMNKSEEHPDFESLTLIQQSASSANELTRKVLDYGRQPSSQFETVQLEDLVDSVLNLIRKSIPSNIAIRTEFEDDLPVVSGIISELQQVIINLCNNSRHAMPMGGQIVVRLKHVDMASSNQPNEVLGDGDFLCLSVEDDGEGMTQETMDNLFTPFYTTKERGEGSGLGLTITRDIVRRHRGHIDVHSHAGAGSTFDIYLPARASDSD